MNHNSANKQKRYDKVYWAVIPAAGIGRRMGSDIPKQYLKICNQTVLEHSVSIFLQHEAINGVVVVVSKEDPFWPDLHLKLEKQTNKTLLIAEGGKERKDSVLSGLKKLDKYLIAEDCQVLVHDAARPCLLHKDIDKLLEAIKEYPDGGLLGLTVNDTLKRCNINQQVEATVDRHLIWRALTPQCFSLRQLIQALENVITEVITDEASAMEHMGKKPLMVSADANNIKITRPEDLLIAEKYLISRQVE